MHNSAKPRIMFVVQSLVKGGAERLVLEISRELIRRDAAEILIVGFENRNEYPELSEGISFVHAAITYQLSVFGNNRIEINSLLQLINEFKPDIIHTNCYLQEAPPREVVFPDIKYFSHLHDNMPAFRNLKFLDLFKRPRLAEYYEKRRLIRKYKKCHNTFISISENTSSYFRKNLPGVLAEKIILLPNAIDFKKFYDLRAREFDGNKTIQLINVGHFAPKKNQIFLLKVVKILKEKNSNVFLKFVGDYKTVKEDFLKEAEQLGVRDSIEMTGMVSNVEQYLKQADIYVHSALYEPFGLVLLEAMAAGLPVVCLDGGGNRDIMEDGKNGFIIYEQNAELFADKIMELITNKQLYSAMSFYAIEFAKKYDIKEYVDNLLKLYKD